MTKVLQDYRFVANQYRNYFDGKKFGEFYLLSANIRLGRFKFGEINKFKFILKGYKVIGFLNTSQHGGDFTDCL